MADRDNNVYLAKLAEQAERYDGKSVDKIEHIIMHVLYPLQKWLRP